MLKKCEIIFEFRAENVFLAYVDERQQLPKCTWFAALGGHAYR